MSNEAPAANTREAETRMLARAGIGLTAIATTSGLVVGIASSVSAAVLVFASGALLGAVLFLWSSLRTLSGDAALPLSAQLDDDGAPGADLFARKNMLLRAIRDLEQEHTIGRLTEEDFATSRDHYRAELRQVLESTDKLLAPHREAAERLAADYQRAHAESVE
jgi:hypothetical protein